MSQKTEARPACSPHGDNAEAAIEHAHWIVEVPRAQEKWMKTHLVSPCVTAGLRCKAFWSSDKSSIFLLIFADRDRLMVEAERSDIDFTLDKNTLRQADIQVNRELQAQGLVFDAENHPVSDPELLAIPAIKSIIPGQDTYDPYTHIFAPLTLSTDATVAEKQLELYYHHRASGSILSNIDALRLLLQIIQNPTEQMGANLHLDRLMASKRIVRYQPGHYGKRKDRMLRQWLLRLGWPWSQPLVKIRNYFGEKVSMYFAFFGTYTLWLAIPAIVGIAMYAYQQKDADVENNSLLAVYSIFVALWATLFAEKWKRNQSSFAMEWGTNNYTEEESLRPEFIRAREVRRIRSYADGKPEYWRAPLRSYFKLGLSTSMISLLAGIVVVAVVSIFYMRIVLVRLEKDGDIAEGWGGYIGSIVTAVQIQIMSFVYNALARKLVEWENHPTQTAHENSLIAKTCCFQFINAYFSLFYIAFVKGNSSLFGESQQCRPDPSNEAAGPDCMYELYSQLLIIFVTRLGMAFVLNTLLPWVKPYLLGIIKGVKTTILCKPTADDNKAVDGTEKTAVSPTEEHCRKQLYDTFDDYLQLMIQFGYVSLFVTAFPLAPLLAFVTNAIELRLDAFRLLHFSARPAPLGAASIGTWFKFLQFMSFISVITNLGVITFTIPESWFGLSDPDMQFAVAVIIEHALIFVKYLVAELIPDIPFSVNLQLTRRRYLVDKHIYGKRDRIANWEEIEEVLATDEAAAGFAVLSDNSMRQNPLRPSDDASVDEPQSAKETPSAAAQIAFEIGDTAESAVPTMPMHMHPS